MMHDLDLDRRAELAAEAVVLRKLWRAVLAHALREAAGFTNRNDVRTRPDLHHRRAYDWIGSRDFREVCDLAGIDISAEEARAAVTGPKADLLIRKSRHDA